MTRFTTPFAAVALCGLAAVAGVGSTASAAGVTNGDFSAGLAGWAAAGNTVADNTSAFGAPPAGSAAQAVMGTAGASAFMFGGAATSAATLETFAGLAAGSLSGLGAVVGSAIAQDFSAGAGDQLRFSWKLMTNEPQNSPAKDTAFWVLDGALTTLANVQTAVLTGFSASPMLDETAYAGVSQTLAAGSHRLVFGVFDAPDASGASALAVSGIQVTAVPEPGSWAMGLAGLGVLGGLARRRGRAGAAA